MAWGAGMVDLRRSDAEKEEAMSPLAYEAIRDYPPGLCIRLTKEELEKLDLDDNVDVGDTIDVRAFATVTAVHKTGEDCCVELQIERMAVENETTEEPDE
jgi:hypothetical protein